MNVKIKTQMDPDKKYKLSKIIEPNMWI